MKIIVFILLLFYLPFSFAQKADVIIDTGVDKAKATTGNIITWTITLSKKNGVDVDIPEIGQNIEGFRITDFGTEDPVTEDGRKRCAIAKTVHGYETRAAREYRAKKFREMAALFNSVNW